MTKKSKQEMDAWELFWDSFSLNDEVLAIDDQDNITQGKLIEVHDDGCHILTPKAHSPTHLWWIDIRFFSHVGFPVRKLGGADGSSKIIHEPNRAAQIRQNHKELMGALAHLEQGPLMELKGIVEQTLTKTPATVVFGDPFLIEAVAPTLLNTGMDAPELWAEDGEECLVLEARDGARGMLYDLNTVYHWEQRP